MGELSEINFRSVIKAKLGFAVEECVGGEGSRKFFIKM